MATLQTHDAVFLHTFPYAAVVGRESKLLNEQ